jgi:tetratricopeptide (TPR) repeat protein
MGFFYFQSRQEAIRFSQALLALKAAESAPDTEEADFEAFSAAAAAWRASSSRPAMPDDVRADKATAEDAFKRKDFAAALYAYGDALDKFPNWPEGHYNAALLAAQVEDYEIAARHMRRYLTLNPDAKDAPAAREKYLLWQRKAKE